MSRLVLTLIVGLLAIVNVYAAKNMNNRQYIIYPHLGLSSQDNKNITGLINEHAIRKDRVHIYTRSQQSEPIFWLAELSEAAARSLSRDDRV